MKPLVVVDSVMEDGECDFCSKSVPLVLSCTFGTGERMCLCRADFFKMVRVRTRTHGRPDAVAHQNGDPIDAEGNGEPITFNSERL